MDKKENKLASEITIDALAQMTQREFTAIRTEMANEFQAVHEEMATLSTKQELQAVRAELKEEIRDVRSAIDSSADRVIGEMKEYLGPFIKSLDMVLVDVEHLKSKVN